MGKARKALIATGAVLAGGVGLAAMGARAEPKPENAPKVAVRTTPVVRTDLADAREFGGTLGYGAERTLRGHKAGTVTWLPRPGRMIGRGDAVYRVDERPVVLFTGTTPFFRTLGKVGTSGRDVRVLNRNLTALGHPAGTGPVFTRATAAAVKRWQAGHARKPDGRFGPGDAVVLPGPFRVGAWKADLGDDAAADLLTITASAKVVTVPMGADQAAAVRRGARVTVVAPGGARWPGRVSGLARNAASAESGEPPKVNVIVTVTAAGTLQSAPVQVRFTTGTRRGVLAVPAGALLALREGGHAVRVKDGPLVPVRTGLFAGGMVEVSGPGLAEGVQVVTTS
ncbi:hypothetical protein ACIBF1_18035 [Spirillospora sp. NPDC050679]